LAHPTRFERVAPKSLFVSISATADLTRAFGASHVFKIDVSRSRSRDTFLFVRHSIRPSAHWISLLPFRRLSRSFPREDEL